MNGLGINRSSSSGSILFMILLCFMLLDWNGLGYYVFYVPFLFFIIKGGFSQIDSNFILLLLFGFSYSAIDYINTGTISYVYNIMPVVNFPISYLMGKMIAENKSSNEQVTIIWLFAISMALLTIISTYVSFGEDGFALVGRDIKLIGYSNEQGEILYSATSLYSKLIPLSLFISFLFILTGKKNRWLFFSSACIALVCCLRLQSRSSMYITSISLLIPLILGGRNKIIGSVAIIGIVTYILTHYSDDLLIIERFQNNGIYDNEGGESRIDLSIKILNNLYSHPYGGLTSNRYAHNLWIDSARVSGWIPVLFLLAVTWNWIKTIIKIYKKTEIDKFYRVFIVMFSTCLLIYFNTEPILEGASMLFTIFCLFFGIISKAQYNYSLSLFQKH